MNANATADGGASIEDRIENILFTEDAPVDDKKPVAQPEGDAAPETDDIEPELQAEEDKGEVETGTLAEYLGVAEDQVIETEDGKVFINVKVDGEQMQVPMQEVIKSYQLQKHVTQKSMQVSEELRQAQAERGQFYGEATNRIAIMEKMTEALEMQFTKQYQGIDWQRLRVENPAEYVAVQKDYENLMAGLNQAKQVTLQQKQQLDAAKEAAEQQVYNAHLANQAQLVLHHNPAWRDPAVRTKETSELRAKLSAEYGFADDELNTVTDYRQIAVIRDALAFRAGQKVAEQKVTKPVPKFQKAGRPAAAMAQMRDAKARRSNLKASGSIDDAAALLLNRM